MTARVISREVARRAARDGVCDRGRGACARRDRWRTTSACRATASRSSSRVADGAELLPGSDVEARVTVAMPAVQLPGIGAVGAWSWTARHREPVDRYAAAPMRARGAVGHDHALAARPLPPALRARRDLARPLARVLGAPFARGDGRCRGAGRRVGDRRGRSTDRPVRCVLVPALAEARARAHVAQQLDRAVAPRRRRARRRRRGHRGRARRRSDSRCSACSHPAATSPCRSPRPRRRGGRNDPAPGTVAVAALGRAARGADGRPGDGPDEWRRSARSRLRARDGQRSRRGHVPRRGPPERRARARVALHVESRARPAAAASSSPARSRPTWRTGSAPCPASSSFPYAPVHVGTLQGAPPGAVRLDARPAAPARACTSAGDFVVDTATPRAGGPTSSCVPRCAPPGAPFFPAPPSAAAIWQQTPLPRATVHASPPGTRAWPGIVNLESRFWSDPLPDARATVDLDGYVVSVVAHPVAYAWSFGDGTVSIGASPGGPDGPARATFRRRGDYGVTLYVVWAGLAHITAPALGSRLRRRSTSAPSRCPRRPCYHEAEIRALLRYPHRPRVASGRHVQRVEAAACSGRSWWGPTGRRARRRRCSPPPSSRPPSPTPCSTS